jgi:predicted membrane channel-forming protein YqfA (hemolysin III family)
MVSRISLPAHASAFRPRKASSVRALESLNTACLICQSPRSYPSFDGLSFKENKYTMHIVQHCYSTGLLAPAHSERVNPKLHLSGSGMILVIILYLWRYDSVSGQVYTAVFALGFNLICFMTSALCHSMVSSEKRLPNLLFRLDHVGIIAHIWATSISVILLEANEEFVSWYIPIATTIGALLSAMYLAVVPGKKEERVLVIGGFGGFAFMNVAWYNVFNSRLSRLTVSYTIMVAINSIGGWFYCRGRGIHVGTGSPDGLFGSGHFLMHVCSLVASAVYAFTMVSWIRFRGYCS